MIWLVGMMGAGKSAVGRQLARLLHLDFIDSDEEIESRTGVDIPFIFGGAFIPLGSLGLPEPQPNIAWPPA